MAYLEINVGGKTSQLESGETSAANILADVAALHNLTGTAQEQLDNVALLLKQVLLDWSKQYREIDAIETAKQNVEDDGDYQWTV